MKDILGGGLCKSCRQGGELSGWFISGLVLSHPQLASRPEIVKVVVWKYTAVYSYSKQTFNLYKSYPYETPKYVTRECWWCELVEDVK